jgi:hypothetical protein
LPMTHAMAACSRPSAVLARAAGHCPWLTNV